MRFAGEYGNCCRLCNKRVSFNNHCGLGTLKKDNFDLRTNDLYAYRCVECNFVQTRYKNIERHLTIQHQRLTVDKKDYKKFMLMPAYQHITEGKLCNPRGERHHGMKLCSVQAIFSSGSGKISNISFAQNHIRCITEAATSM